jgi:hypothetical protein
MGTGRNAVEPEQFVENAQLERRVQVTLAGSPAKADDQGPLQQGGVYGKAKRGEKDKKKATPKTWSKISA